MTRLLFLLTTMLVLLPVGCSEDPTEPSPEPELEIISLDRVVHSNGEVEVTLELLQAKRGPDEWRYMDAELRNLTDRKIRYDGGSCGCPFLLLDPCDEEGRTCVVNLRMCPCTMGNYVFLEPDESLIAGSLLKGQRCDAHQMVVRFAYELVPIEPGSLRHFEVSYVLPEEEGPNGGRSR